MQHQAAHYIEVIFAPTTTGLAWPAIWRHLSGTAECAERLNNLVFYHVAKLSRHSLAGAGGQREERERA